MSDPVMRTRTDPRGHLPHPRRIDPRVRLTTEVLLREVEALLANAPGEAIHVHAWAPAHLVAHAAGQIRGRFPWLLVRAVGARIEIGLGAASADIYTTLGAPHAVDIDATAHGEASRPPAARRALVITAPERYPRVREL